MQLISRRTHEILRSVYDFLPTEVQAPFQLGENGDGGHAVGAVRISSPDIEVTNPL
jgi:hypothetical protein